MTELKILKDLKHLVEREEGIPDYEAVDLLTLKAESIMWVKEDTFDLENADIGAYDILDRWMKRLDITNEDLK